MDNAKFDGISRWCYYTRTELIDSIVELAKRLGHTPTRTELARDIYTPSVKAYERAFGTVANAIHAANLPASDPLVKQCYSDDELISFIQKKAEHLHRVPTAAEVERDPNLPCAGTFKRRLGNWETVIRRAGLDPTPILRRTYTQEQLIAILQHKAAALGRTPAHADVTHDPRMPAVSTFIKKFGSWNNALTAAGLTINDRRALEPTRERLLTALVDLIRQLGHLPTEAEAEAAPGVPAVAKYAETFGSLSHALDVAERRIYVASR